MPTPNVALLLNISDKQPFYILLINSFSTDIYNKPKFYAIFQHLSRLTSSISTPHKASRGNVSYLGLI